MLEEIRHGNDAKVNDLCYWINDHIKERYFRRSRQGKYISIGDSKLARNPYYDEAFIQKPIGLWPILAERRGSKPLEPEDFPFDDDE